MTQDLTWKLEWWNQHGTFVGAGNIAMRTPQREQRLLTTNKQKEKKTAKEA
jgi:hypothetical protein